MANGEMLRNKIRASGLKMEWLAKAAGMSDNSFRMKLKGSSDFKVSEAKRISEILNLSEAERDACFWGGVIL